MATITVTDSSFSADVLDSEKPVLVDFWATWCGPCRMIAPVLEQISNEKSASLTIAKLDIDENPQIAQDFKIMSVPTMILFKDGKPVKQIVGAQSKTKLLQVLEEHIGA